MKTKANNEVTLAFPSRSSNEGFARAAVSCFAAQMDPTLNELEDIKTAVSEAVTNAIVHAYPDSIGQVVVKVRICPDQVLEVTVRDHGRGVDPEDLYQLGCLGFLKAVQGFDFDYGTCFSTYAVPKIAGEIRRFLRDDGAVKVGRTMREQAQTLYTIRERLRQELGREPVLRLCGRRRYCSGLQREKRAGGKRG